MSQSTARAGHPGSLVARLRARLIEDPGTGCHVWTGPLDRLGYARIAVGGRRNRLAHRIAYEADRGPIPPGLSIDHLCRNKPCCNPAHMEAVTLAENSRRSWATRVVPTHCKRGHEFTPENTYTHTEGRRQCRECTRLRGAKQLPLPNPPKADSQGGRG